MKINITGGELSAEELEYYKEIAFSKYGNGCYQLDIDIDGEYVNVRYYVTPFDRIRRITGYLVGTMDRFNDAKREEVQDRVKHGGI